MLELLEAVFLGVVQGLTEFLPLSSSGHLLLSQYFLGMDQERFGLSFDAAIHTGTILAVVWFFWEDLLSMGRAFLRSLPRPNFADAEVRMAYLILIATVPAAIIGFLFEDFFATQVRHRGWSSSTSSSSACCSWWQSPSVERRRAPPSSALSVP